MARKRKPLTQSTWDVMSPFVCLLDVYGQSVIRGNEKRFIELLANGRDSLEYARNVAKKFDDPEPDDPSSNSNIRLLSSRLVLISITRTPNAVPTMKKKLGKLTVRAVAVSCEVLLAFSHRVETGNQTFTKFSFSRGKNNISLEHKIHIFSPSCNIL